MHVRRRTLDPGAECETKKDEEYYDEQRSETDASFPSAALLLPPGLQLSKSNLYPGRVITRPQAASRTAVCISTIDSEIVSDSGIECPKTKIGTELLEELSLLLFY